MEPTSQLTTLKETQQIHRKAYFGKLMKKEILSCVTVWVEPCPLTLRPWSHWDKSPRRANRRRLHIYLLSSAIPEPSAGTVRWEWSSLSVSVIKSTDMTVWWVRAMKVIWKMLVIGAATASHTPISLGDWQASQGLVTAVVYSSPYILCPVKA